MINQDSFYITGDNFKRWLHDIDLQSVANLPYVISGDYKKGNISNLKLEIAQHTFTGSVSGKYLLFRFYPCSYFPILCISSKGEGTY